MRTGLDNDLGPNRRQTITWTTDGIVYRHISYVYIQHWASVSPTVSTHWTVCLNGYETKQNTASLDNVLSLWKTTSWTVRDMSCPSLNVSILFLKRHGVIEQKNDLLTCAWSAQIRTGNMAIRLQCFDTNDYIFNFSHEQLMYRIHLTSVLQYMT